MRRPFKHRSRRLSTVSALLAVAARLMVAWLVVACPAHAGDAAGRVDASSLTGKLIMGYQGWFACPGDAAGRSGAAGRADAAGRWVHWFHGADPTVDLLPDTSELPPAERCATSLTAADGQKVALFSDRNPATVARHFAWMQQYGLDGVALQRFASQLPHPPLRAAADLVLDNVRQAAEAHGRVFFLMYDLSGLAPADLPAVAQDWQRLQAGGLTRSPAYLQHRGHPLLGLWGLGFAHRTLTPALARHLLDGLADASARDGGVTFLGGVPAGWRTGQRDADADPGWQTIWPRLGVVSPWTVGRYADAAGADAYRKTYLLPDLAQAARLHVDDMPVVFPGFSWAHLMAARHRPGFALNQIPRDCGRFYWRQVFDAASAGATMLYGAMFDEVDEGTAMFKLVPSAAEAPASPPFVTLDADGCRLPSDWYLRLAGAATQVLRRGRPLSAALPSR